MDENKMADTNGTGGRLNLSSAFTKARQLVADYSSGSGSDSVDSEPVSPRSNKPPTQNKTETESSEDDDDELEELRIPIEEINITLPPDQCKEVGKVKYVVDKQVVIEPNVGLAALDLDTVLFLDEGHKALGRVEDVFGPIHEPLYSVRFNSAKDIAEKDVKAGVQVYYAPSTNHTSYVFLPDLMKMKGSDASGEHNQELPPELHDCSDDESESQKNKKGPVSAGEKRPHSTSRPRVNLTHKPRGHQHRYQRVPKWMPPIRPPLQNIPQYPPPSATPFNPNVPPPPPYNIPPPFRGPPPPPFPGGPAPPPMRPFVGFSNTGPLPYSSYLPSTMNPRPGPSSETAEGGYPNIQPSPSVVQDMRNYQRPGP